jgi:hypothetical protein
MQSFIDPTPPKLQGKEAALSSSESLSSEEKPFSEHYMSDLFSDLPQQQDEFMDEWAAQQSSVDAGNLQEQPHTKSGIKFNNFNIQEEKEGLEDDKEIAEDDNLFCARMQGKQRQQIASKIRQMQEDNVAFKNDDVLKLDSAAAKELAEAKIVTAQTWMDLHKNDSLEVAASFRLQPQKLSEHYNLGDFGYLVGQCGSIPLERTDEHGRMNYH